jgi:GTP-binding protein Era
MTPAPAGPPGHKSGFAAILGPPNAGKSTLLNRLLGQKISITSSKPQTTRDRILGVLHRPGAQVVFFDTPGVHRTERLLNRRIVETALGVLPEVDLAVLIVDAAHPDPLSEDLLLGRLADFPHPVLLALNKIDMLPKADLLRQIQAWSQRRDFAAIVPVSAAHGTQVEDLVDALLNQLPEGPPFYPEDTLTDRPLRFLVAEIIREKVFRLTGAEIPYATAVTVEVFEEPEEAAAPVRIQAAIHVERESQKGIVIGRGGGKLKEIGTAARLEIQTLLERPVYLKLFLRVEKNWTRDTRALRKFGYE